MVSIYNLFSAFFLLFVPMAFAMGQAPEIYSITPSKASPTDKIEISGKNFGISSGNVAITFGATQAEAPMIIKDNMMEVKVPVGAIHKPVTVTRKDLKLSATSSRIFLPSFGGTGIDNIAFLSQSSINALAGVNDFAVGDMDNDGKVDIVMANTGSNSISILLNNSTSIGTITFKTIIQLSVNAPTDHISLADLDGDGLLDVIATEYQDATHTGEKIFVLRNSSTSGSLNFDPYKAFTISGFDTQRTDVADLDLDGKPEIVVSNNKGASFAILKNQISGSILSSSFLINKVAIDSVSKTSCVIIRDLNNDRLPDIIVSEDQKNNIQLFQNRSNLGNIVFRKRRSFLIAGTISRVQIADLNSDRKPDIVVTKQETGNITVLENTTLRTGGIINFSLDQLNFSTVSKPWGIDAGDVDGDGKVDLVIASLNENRITILKNNGLSSVEFERKNISVSETTQNIKLADLDGDGKQEIILNGILNSKIYILRNNNCFIPTIVNGTTITACGSSYKIETTKGLGITDYEWKLNGVVKASGINTSYEATQSGNYTVTTTGPDGCIKTSRSFSLTLSNATAPSAPTVTSFQTICAGSTLNLSTTDASGSFKWQGPGGFSSSESSPSISAASTDLSGIYSVRKVENGCESNPSRILVIVRPYTFANIETASPTTCSGNTITLSSSVTNNVTFQWRKDNNSIAGATSSTYTTGSTASESGSYTLVVTNTESCSYETDPLSVNVVEKPQADFSVSRTCIGQGTQFTDKSVISDGIVPEYFWMFGDLKSAGVSNPVHEYEKTGTYTVRLRVSYGADCMHEITKDIDIKYSPPFSIQHLNDTSLCPGEIIVLKSPEIFGNPVWSTGIKGNELEVKLPGTYSLSALSPDGCEVYDDINIIADPAPEITIFAEKNVLKEGESVNLSASGAVKYVWEPAEFLNDPSIAAPSAKPLKTTVFSVNGFSENGCAGTASIKITVDESLDVEPSKTFTPNGDTKNDYWLIQKIDIYPDCQVSVFTREGQNVFDSKPFPAEGWNGTYKGKTLPNGVYFYVIKCNGINKSKTGSITLVH